MIEPTEAVIRLLIVFLLAFGIGLERQLRRKPVGFGTFIFVATGAAECLGYRSAASHR